MLFKIYIKENKHLKEKKEINRVRNFWRHLSKVRPVQQYHF
jgi:hypothetical protein